MAVSRESRIPIVWQRYHHLLARQMAAAICQQSGLLCRVQVLDQFVCTSWQLMESFPPLALAEQRRASVGPPTGHGYPILLAFQSELAQTLVDRVLGGPGRWPGGARLLTELEAKVLRPLLLRFWEATRESWPGVGTLVYETAADSESTGGPVTSRRSLELRSAREILVRHEATRRWWVVQFGVQLPSGQGMAWLGFPRELVEQEPETEMVDAAGAADALGAAGAAEAAEIAQPVCETVEPVQRSAPAPKREPAGRDNGSDRPVEVAVVLGRVRLHLDELLDLECGDIIRLGQPVDAELTVFVNGTPSWLAQPGTHRGRLAVRLTREHSVPKEVASA